MHEIGKVEHVESGQTSSESQGQCQTAKSFSIKLLVKLCHQSCYTDHK